MITVSYTDGSLTLLSLLHEWTLFNVVDVSW